MRSVAVCAGTFLRLCAPSEALLLVLFLLVASIVGCSLSSFSLAAFGGVEDKN